MRPFMFISCAIFTEDTRRENDQSRKRLWRGSKLARAELGEGYTRRANRRCTAMPCGREGRGGRRRRARGKGREVRGGGGCCSPSQAQSSVYFLAATCRRAGEGTSARGAGGQRYGTPRANSLPQGEPLPPPSSGVSKPPSPQEQPWRREHPPSPPEPPSPPSSWRGPPPVQGGRVRLSERSRGGAALNA